MTRYIDEHRDEFGVEPICEVLQVAPSTYYAAKRRPPSARALDDASLKAAIVRLHEDTSASTACGRCGGLSCVRASSSGVTTSPV